MLLIAVTLSVLGLAAGPLLLAWGKGRALPSAAIEGATLGLVPAVVLLRLVPHVFEEIGPLALALVAAGYAALWIVERRSHRSLGRAGQIVALPALVLHAAADGATLGVVLGDGGAAARGAAQGGALLAAALLVHRLPEGLFVARALVPESGWRSAIAWLGALASATVAGALLGERALSLAPHEVVHGVVAVGLGAILRLATHTHERTPQRRGGVLAFVGALAAGLALNAAVPAASLHGPHEVPAHAPGPATLAGAVALVVIVGVGLLRFAPRAWRSRLSPPHDAASSEAAEHEHHHEHRVEIPPPAARSGARQ